MELCGFCQQDARDVEVGEHHFRGSIEGLIVGAFESVALDRRVQQETGFVEQVVDVLFHDIEGLIVQQMVDPDQNVRQGVQPGEPGVLQHQFKQQLC